MSGPLPAGACDAHCHVFGPSDRFPYDPGRTYTPDDAPKEALMGLHRRLGFDRSVIVQAGCHGFDNRVTLDAIAASGGRYRGIAIVSDDVTAQQIAELHAGGIRGIRINFMPHLAPPPAEAVFRRVIDLIAPQGWHTVFHVGARDLEAVTPYLRPLQIPFVIDHMARISAADGVTREPFHRLLELARDPRAWLKISGADRASCAGAPYHDTLPFMRTLIETAPDRILWGTDWPHPNITGPIPDEKTLLDLLARAAPEPKILHRILVENPDRLYRFEA